MKILSFFFKNEFLIFKSEILVFRMRFHCEEFREKFPQNSIRHDAFFYRYRRCHLDGATFDDGRILACDLLFPSSRDRRDAAFVIHWRMGI